MTLSIKAPIDRVLQGARRIVRDYGDRAHRSDSIADAIAVLGCVGHHDLGWVPFQQGLCLRRVAALACGQPEVDGASQAAHGHMDFGARAAT